MADSVINVKIMLIVYSNPGRGWSPINHMVNLAGELFGAEFLELNHPVNKWKQFESIIWPRCKTPSSDTCLVICASPIDLPSPLQIKNWRKRFRCITAWVIDSFWTNWIPRLFQYSSLYDHIYITSSEDIPEWESKTKAHIHYLPWGSDVLQLGTGTGARPLDVLRVGRQPPEWDDDEITNQCCIAKNIHFSGRPPFGENPKKDQELLMETYGKTKYLLAFSNLSSPTPSTHPTKEYITGRWTDAIACGAIVAGISPKGKGDYILWEGATLELETTVRERGLDIISDALRNWTPNLAASNYLQALKGLDWRWRFKTIAETMGEKSTALNEELISLQGRIDSLSGV